jgi:hypothetical protein
MELIRKWWSVLRVVIITSGVISLILWYVAKSQCNEINCPMTWNTLGLLIGGWAVFYVAVKRVMARLYCPLRKLQSLLMICFRFSPLQLTDARMEHGGNLYLSASQPHPSIFTHDARCG